MEFYGKRRLEGRYSRHRLEFTRGMGRSRLPDNGRQHKPAGAAKAGLVSRGLAGIDRASSMDGLRLRFQDRKDSMGTGSQQHASGASQASQEQLLFRNSGDRRRAGLLLLR